MSALAASHWVACAGAILVLALALAPTALSAAIRNHLQESSMSKEGIEGATQKGVGAVKEAVGKAVGNEKLQGEGMADKAVGSAKEAVGKVKDAVHKATD
jgi:uncharacterized protein YjbJ (UPF0337 family)